MKQKQLVAFENECICGLVAFRFISGGHVSNGC